MNVANASETNQVVFICHRKRIEAKPPFLSQGVDPSSDVFNRIQMKYVDDDEGIRNYFAVFHLHLDFPAAVVIDDFGDYFTQLNSKGTLMNSRARDMAMVRTLALGHNAIIDANKMLQRCLFCLRRCCTQGMTCGGCSASVNKILESQPQVPVPHSETVDKCTRRGEAVCSTCNADGEPGFYMENQMMKCSSCYGRGLIAHKDGSDTICTYCNGKGKLPCPNCQSRGLIKCQTCTGTGSLLTSSIAVVRWKTLSKRKVSATRGAGSVPEEVFHRAEGVQL